MVRWRDPDNRRKVVVGHLVAPRDSPVVAGAARRRAGPAGAVLGRGAARGGAVGRGDGQRTPPTRGRPDGRAGGARGARAAEARGAAVRRSRRGARSTRRDTPCDTPIPPIWVHAEAPDGRAYAGAIMADPQTYRPATGTIPEAPGVYRFSDAERVASSTSARPRTCAAGSTPTSPTWRGCTRGRGRWSPPPRPSSGRWCTPRSRPSSSSTTGSRSSTRGSTSATATTRPTRCSR